MTLNWKTLLVIVSLAAAFAAGWALRPVPPAAAPPLPANVVPVEVVREIPGPERVVERVRWRTRDVPVPVPANCPAAAPTKPLVTSQPLAPSSTSPSPGSSQARIEIDAEKLEGLVDNDLRWGWRGRARCLLKAPGAPWQTIVDEPIDLTASTAISTLRPIPQAWRLDLGLSAWTDESAELSATWGRAGRVWRPAVAARYSLDPDVGEGRWALGGGVSLRLGR